MIIFDIPYAPLHPGEWCVGSSNDGHSEFNSRLDALRFAISAALKVQQEGNDALITVEGIDGQWRKFDHRAKGIV
ncbi:hypothetical protein EAH75_19320 [Rhodanobacter glycinis]|uniref:hypothetical protein n=1 Tax=Rhodanobacter glycinis TaxID=582702 RepID=UPI00112B8EAD|nr:hypothetical protein [Rhodanobacter glycinis]TPG44848.1 hypothetical protein EAH75_19320 [Rhodanobacter glycinis]